MQSPGKDARAAGSAVPYERHRPETTLLYQLVEAHYPVFVAQLATRGTPLPEYVQREFTDYLRCGRLEHGFLEDPDVIQKILTHLQLNTKATAPSPLPEPRAPPISDLFDTL